MNKEQLLELAQAAPDNALDELVHEMYASMASSVNNGGYSEQIEKLLEWGWNPEKLADHIRKATP